MCPWEQFLDAKMGFKSQYLSLQKARKEIDSTLTSSGDVTSLKNVYESSVNSFGFTCFY